MVAQLTSETKTIGMKICWITCCKDKDKYLQQNICQMVNSLPACLHIAGLKIIPVEQGTPEFRQRHTQLNFNSFKKGCQDLG